jgi:hypothetical protein
MNSPLARAASLLGLVLLGVVLVGSAAWGVLALAYFEPLPPALRTCAAIVYGLIGLVALFALFRPGQRLRALAVYAAAFAVLLVAWFQIPPSNERDWREDQALLPYATVSGDLVTVHNIRNFDYRAEFDWTPAYYDRTFDVSKLDEVDLFAVYWMGPSIAHGIISFGFSDGTHLAVSIEARNTVGEGYSTVKGFFRQYELMYVVADERDVIRLRTNYRHNPNEDTYLFKLRGTPEDARRFFLNYIHKINSLKEHPEFYNSLTDNCITGIWQNARVGEQTPPFSWQLLLSGHVPQYLYERGRLDTAMPFEELRRRAYINDRAHAADKAADFSQRIRTPPPP